MNKTTMLGLTEPVLQAVINQYDLKPYYYPTLFPLKARAKSSEGPVKVKSFCNPSNSFFSLGVSTTPKAADFLAATLANCLGVGSV